MWFPFILFFHWHVSLCPNLKKNGSIPNHWQFANHKKYSLANSFIEYISLFQAMIVVEQQTFEAVKRRSLKLFCIHIQYK